MLLHLPPPSGSYPVRFDRFSPYHRQAEEYGLDLHPSDFYELIYPFSRESLANLAYYFMDHNFTSDYFKMMVKWIGRVREKVEMWRSRWDNKDQAPPPILYLKETGDPTIVYDSRSGETIEHQISDVGGQLLEHLASPKRISDLASELSHIPSFDPVKELAFLEERGLVFREDQRVMSLVLPTGLSQMKGQTGWTGWRGLV